MVRWYVNEINNEISFVYMLLVSLLLLLLLLVVVVVVPVLTFFVVVCVALFLSAENLGKFHPGQ